MPTIKQLKKIILKLEGTDENELRNLLKSTSLLSLTQPVFFDDLILIVKNIAEKNIQGDFIEVGTWRGGTALFLKGLIKHYKLAKKLWLFDNFDEKLDLSIYKQEKDKKAINLYFSWNDIIVPTKKYVINNFKKFNLYDSDLKIIKGDIFKTYSNYSDKKISLLRIDIDFYESTFFVLEKFYDKVEKGGFIIIDDYGVDKFNCKDAVDKFRNDNNITNELIKIGDFIVYWIK